MKDAIRTEIRGIKCDTKGCDYADMDVPVEDYPQWVNKPCPNCGGNLLTEADYQTVKFVLSLADTMNAFIPKVSDTAEDGRISVKLDGSGKVDVEMTEVPAQERMRENLGKLAQLIANTKKDGDVHG